MGNVQQALEIVGITILLSLFNEFMNWALVYRLFEYKVNIANVEKVSKDIDLLKNKMTQCSPNEQTTIKRKVKEAESKLKILNPAMFGIKFKSTIVSLISTVAMFSFLGRAYEKAVVLTLPFEPISFVRSMSHRSLEGQNFYECSYLFVYILSNLCIRPAISKFFGFEPPKASQKSMWTLPEMDDQ